MNFDELLKDAWQGETHSTDHRELTRRIRRRQWRLRLLRAVEVALTVMAVLVFGRALLSGRLDPAHWLLMPFFVVFLPMAWATVQRAPRQHATASTSSYARLRLAQLRAGLRDLWLARTTAWWLLGYAVVANVGVWLLAGGPWREAGLALLVVAVASVGVTAWVNRTLRQRWLREYRAVKRLVPG
ncbi:hypothetical protein [Luteimonas arsenica]|uniref:hypothetical protein n=1 Tax=Luteimonas arsenica TaxID=1586242 RepID=UPI001055ACD3|nr:hypothetical protein [Luteimonas arsenica]